MGVNIIFSRPIISLLPVVSQQTTIHHLYKPYRKYGFMEETMESYDNMKGKVCLPLSLTLSYTSWIIQGCTCVCYLSHIAWKLSASHCWWGWCHSLSWSELSAFACNGGSCSSPDWADWALSTLNKCIKEELTTPASTKRSYHSDLLTSNYAFTVHVKISEWLVEQRSSPDGANLTWFTTPQCPRKSWKLPSL